MFMWYVICSHATKMEFKHVWFYITSMRIESRVLTRMLKCSDREEARKSDWLLTHINILCSLQYCSANFVCGPGKNTIRCEFPLHSPLVCAYFGWCTAICFYTLDTLMVRSSPGEALSGIKERFWKTHETVSFKISFVKIINYIS